MPKLILSAIYGYMKTCFRCHLPKPLSEFHKQAQKPDGYRPVCKQCRSFDSANYYSTNREYVKGKWKKYLETHPDYNREYYQSNPKYFEQYYASHADHYRQWRWKNRKRIAVWRKQYKEQNPTYKVACSLRSRISSLIRKAGVKKEMRSTELLGCSIDEFRKYLETQFKVGMAWSNYGKWHIDHIVPCCSFDLTNVDEQKKCFHYTNQQPLWANDNLKKSGKH